MPAPAAAPPAAPAVPAPVEPRAAAPALSAAALDDRFDDGEIDAYAHEPPFRPRRNPARVWTIVATVVALLLTAAIGGVAWFGPARVMALAGLHGPQFDTPLLIMSQVHPAQKTPSGNELLPVSGRIVNSADTAQPVPDILVEVLDAHSRVVYSWTVPRPAATIAAHASIPFNSATVDPPMSATKLRFTFVGVVPK